MEFEERKQSSSGFNSPMGKKIHRTRQGNEYTAVNSRQEGICYLCFGKDWVSPTIIDVCVRRAAKKGKEAILAVVYRSPYGYCYAHGGYSTLEYLNNLAQLNVRVCKRCQKRVAKKHMDLKRIGAHKFDPFWVKMRKTLGKDYEMLGVGLGGSLRR